MSEQIASREWSDPVTSREQALESDRGDPLGGLRARFTLPSGVIYLDGNSLGALPSHVPAAVADAVSRQWGTDLISSWNDNGWWQLPGQVGDRIGALIGAAPGQVICGDSTSIQLFQALTALARLRPGRCTLITDGANFPTDQYLAESVATMLGLDLVRCSPADLPQIIGADTALVAFSAVDYRTGELWDADTITQLAHHHGALMLWDLSHAVGALPFEVDALGADAAVGCSYKYLNGGPGAPAWLYLPHHHQGAQLPLTGWHGHSEPFALEPTYTPAVGIARGRIGTPPILGMLALEAALDVWDGVDLGLLRAKSLALTDLVIDFAAAHLAEFGVEVLTPRERARRGSQVALRLPQAYEVTRALVARGVVGDFRAPDILRLGLTPLYLGFAEVWDAMQVLKEVLATRSHPETGLGRDPHTVT
ncbi:MAG: kynureninase [Actinomycetota bacterium]|nr:kynureninase [Actinomycetota bacterium]